MKTHKKGSFIIKGIFFALTAGVVFTVALMLLWNWLMPLIFGLIVITFWQALGLIVLSKILFGGKMHGDYFHKHNREKYWKERFKEKIDFAKAHHGNFTKPGCSDK